MCWRWYVLRKMDSRVMGWVVDFEVKGQDERRRV